MADIGFIIKVGVPLFITGVGAASGIAYAAFKRWGEKYVDSKFDKAMEKLKYQHQFEIELLKGSVQGEVSRATRFFEQEFTALTQLHKLLVRCASSAQDALHKFQEAPSVVGVPDHQVRAMLEKSEVGEDDIQTVLDEIKPFGRQKVVADIWISRKVKRAWQDWADFRNYRLDHCIFFDEEILEKVFSIDKLIEAALDEWRLEREHPDPRPNRYPLRDKMIAEVPALRDEMEKLLRARVTLAVRPTPSRPIHDPLAP